MLPEASDVLPPLHVVNQPSKTTAVTAGAWDWHQAKCACFEDGLNCLCSTFLQPCAVCCMLIDYKENWCLCCSHAPRTTPCPP
ncbi:hypothetical protein Ciccas_006829 [Cichlidogyrus casuarinus]|uniref:Cornifelin n=1 Tax=Cichlidogyrus casuarinus TaxID=1844966 RepID=A0ABD2Q4L8_9PLAT